MLNQLAKAMHEYYLTRSILDSILRKTKKLRGVKRIVSVKIKVGQANMVKPETLKDIFREVAAQTICRDTNLIVDEIQGSDVIIQDVEAEFEN